MRGGYMYIYKINIKNFRGIKELTWKPNQKRNVLIGANACGKSTVGKALDYLLNPYMQWYKRKLNVSDYYNRDVNNQIEIEVWFKDVIDFIADDNDLLLQHITGDEIDEQGDEVAVILKFVGDANCEPSHFILSGGNEHPLYQKQKGLVGYKYLDVERNPEKELTFVTNTLVNKRFQDETLGESIQKIISDFDTYATTELMHNAHFSETLCELASSFNEFGILESHEESVSIEPTELMNIKHYKRLA
jgi:energy-coupling factor transporter ATP-binding protein EcfA2